MPFVHRVAQGECLASIARRYHFADWRTIYYHPQNADFRGKRSNPNVIYPGDRVYIPDLDSGERDAATDQRHLYVVKWSKASVRFIIEDDKGTPFANKQYHLQIDGTTREGTTGADGSLDLEIQPTAQNGELTVFLNDDEYDDCTWPLRLGHLDPIEEVSGVQARLNNLGCVCGSGGRHCGRAHGIGRKDTSSADRAARYWSYRPDAAG
jgi:hypothetical protein